MPADNDDTFEFSAHDLFTAIVDFVDERIQNNGPDSMSEHQASRELERELRRLDKLLSRLKKRKDE